MNTLYDKANLLKILDIEYENIDEDSSDAYLFSVLEDTVEIYNHEHKTTFNQNDMAWLCIKGES